MKFHMQTYNFDNKPLKNTFDMAVFDWPCETLTLCHRIFIKSIYIFFRFIFQNTPSIDEDIVMRSIELSKNCRSSHQTQKQHRKLYSHLKGKSQLFAPFSLHSDTKSTFYFVCSLLRFVVVLFSLSKRKFDAKLLCH